MLRRRFGSKHDFSDACMQPVTPPGGVARGVGWECQSNWAATSNLTHSARPIGLQRRVKGSADMDLSGTRKLLHRLG
jgi:hypothetical protein